jgi:hypothetical protein
MAFRSRIGHRPDRVPEIGQRAQLMDDLADITIVMPSANADIVRAALSAALCPHQQEFKQNLAKRTLAAEETISLEQLHRSVSRMKIRSSPCTFQAT